MNISTKYGRNLFLFFKILAVLLQCGNAQNNALCNQCLENGVACLDHVRFATCYKGLLTDNITRCPANKVCTADTQICLEHTPDIEPVCYENQCGTCEYTNGRFACLDETTYGFCYGGMAPNLASIRVCPLDHVCDYNSPQICTPKGVAAPSCIPSNATPVTEDPTTTTMDSSISTDVTTTVDGAVTETTTDSPTTTVSDATDTTTDSSTTAVSDVTETTTTDSPTTDVSDTTETTTDGTSTDASDTTETTTDSSTTDVSDTTKTTTDGTSTDASDSTETTTDSSTTDVIDTTETTTDGTSTDASDTTETTTTDSPTTDVSDNTQLTTDGTTTGASDTTETTTNPTTVETTPTDPSTFCAHMQSTGYFRAVGDTSCKDYIYCYLLAGQYLGQKYTCAGYFNAGVGKCQNERPAEC